MARSYPVDCAQEGDNNCSVADLDWLKQVQVVVRTLVAHQEVVHKLRLGGPFRVQIPAEVCCSQRGSEVRKGAGKTQLV